MNTQVMFTEEQKQILINKTEIDEIYLNDILFGLKVIKAQDTTPFIQAELIELIRVEGIAFIENAKFAGTVSGAINLLLKADTTKEYEGMFVTLAKLSFKRVSTNTPTQEELDFCKKIYSLFDQWLEAFLKEYDPAGLVQLLAVRKRKFDEAMDQALTEMRGRLYNESFFNHGRSHRRQESPALQKAKSAFKDMHKPAPEGTVKELAAKFGVSLGEIRRRKQEGTLHELG